MYEFYRCDRKTKEGFFRRLASNFLRFAAFQVDHSVQTEQDYRQLEIEQMVVDAKKEGCGIV